MLDLAVAKLGIECAPYRLVGALCLRGGNREANRVLGTALRNQDHRDAGIAQSAE
jgi:hypothetical protein